MAVMSVQLKTSAMWLCLNHCLLDRSSHSVGLLFGEKDSENDIIIYEAVFCERIFNKDEDYAYPSHESFLQAADYAEKFSIQYGRDLYCVGVYHSHSEFSCVPTAEDHRMLLRFSEALSSDFLLMIFSVFLTKETEKFARYPLYQRHFLPELDESDQKTFKGHALRSKIEFLSASINHKQELCYVPTIIDQETDIKQPRCLSSLCSFPADLIEKREKIFNDEMMEVAEMSLLMSDYLESMGEPINQGAAGLSNALNSLNILNMRAAQTSEILKIISDVYAPIIKLLEERVADSVMKKRYLLVQRNQLEDDVKVMKRLVALHV